MKYAAFFLVCCAATLATAQSLGGNSLPVPPPGATVFSQIEQMSGWAWCNDPGCAGGSGNGTYWMAQNQNQPSLSGASAEVFNSGSWANALWYKKMGAGHDSATNFLWDFYVQLDSNAGAAAQSLEYDAFQFLNGYNYMIGTQCNIAAGVWDLWDEANGHWKHTKIACSGFPAGTWHHIQWYMTTNHTNHTYTYITLVVDGKATPVNATYSAKNIGWNSNVGVQYQLDVNGSGQGYTEWFDNSKLSIW